MIGIGVAGATGSVSAAELSRLRSDFARQNFIRLPGFADARLIAQVQRKLRGGEYQDFYNAEGVDVRETPKDPAAGVFLWLILNDRRLFDFVEAVTGEAPIASLTGGVYRMRPRTKHHLGWHKDLDLSSRAAAMTINLSTKPVRGGVLQFRTAPGRRRLGEVPYTRAGDAVLFRIGQDLQHRSTAVEGAQPKTIYVCWFQRARSGRDG
jgi:hypothetical protein